MPRTIDSKVRQIIATNSNISLAPFIATANSLVNWLERKDVDNELDAATLELIEQWLAAHFYAHHDQLYQAKATGRASATFQGKTDMGLKSTQYGQAALNLDTTGLLAQRDLESLRGKRKGSITWLGKDRRCANGD